MLWFGSVYRPVHCSGMLTTGFNQEGDFPSRSVQSVKGEKAEGRPECGGSPESLFLK